ncbi:MAG TPA: DUF1292 domain-containing protein [Peptococcaceae bacterium]|nr:DUF1292 domain-containing protein [Peptococcaceae bacterium]
MTDEINKQDEMEEVYDVVVLNDDDGNEHEFMHLATLEVEGNTYYVLLPMEEVEEDEAEAVILKVVKDENGEEMLVDIEDDEEWEKVADAWEEMEDMEDEEE